MEKVITNPTFQSYLPNYFILKKLIITIQELVVGMYVSLEKTNS